MKLPQVFRWFLGVLLTVACAMGGSGMLSLAYAAKVPPPPKPPIETLIEPGDGLIRTKYGQAKEHVHKIKPSPEHHDQQEKQHQQDQ
jgi:hypothetical protein